jgi:endonuclease/exonuclease/phosphatase (EEP) superfamily protein YafD
LRLFATRPGRLRGAIQWVARIAVLATLLLAVSQATAYSVEGMSTWWLELLQYVPYPAYLLPAIATFALSFVLTWAWRVAAALGVVLVATVVMGFVWGHADAGSGRLRMMTYNIKAYLAEHRTGGFEQLAQEVARHDPDILVMQDAGEFAQARLRAPELGASIFAGRNVFAHGQYIVVSRFPLRDCRPGDMSYGKEEPADFLHCIVTARGLDIDLFTAHLLSPRRGLNATRRERVEGIDDWQQNFADRLTQARALAAGVAGHRRPLIVAGDLNASETSPVIRTLLGQGLRDAFSSAGQGYGYTHGHALKLGISFLRIDHILVSPEIGVTDAFPGGWQASEHRPVIADLLLQRSR